MDIVDSKKAQKTFTFNLISVSLLFNVIFLQFMDLNNRGLL